MYDLIRKVNDSNVAKNQIPTFLQKEFSRKANNGKYHYDEM